jgi:GNAT superfamily N-acetyltransferase
MNFHEALTTTYLENPCRTLPNALWKTLAQVEILQTNFQVRDGTVTQLEAWDETRLLVYWTRRRDQEMDVSKYLENPHLALVHQDYRRSIPRHAFKRHWRSFRLLYRSGGHLGGVTMPPGFNIQWAEPHREVRLAADFINQCYPGMHLKSDTVRSWTEHPVYDSNLWVWIVDEKTGEPAGLGIAELDREIAEGSLEWIQVHPQYRRRGVGASLVKSLLVRLDGIAQFTTVAGRIDNPTAPETLYRHCGFTGNDIWWVFSN